MYAYDSKNDRWIPLRTTGEYKAKKRWVRNLWTGACMVMPWLPLSGILTLALLLTFVSFMILDESNYSFEVK